jgi:beta-glucanase (GH16 family)
MGNAGGWHIFSADWRPGVVRFFYDHAPVGTIRRGITGAPMFLILNLGVSSSISPPIRVPSEMRVDWVRVTA